MVKYLNLALSVSIVAASFSASAASSLGNLEKPLNALSAITSFTEDVQKNRKSDLGNIVDNNDCDRKVVLPDEQPPLKAGDMQVLQFIVEIGGAACPVTYKAVLEGTQVADGFDAKISFLYEAKTPEAKQLYDVDAFAIDGKILAKMIQVPNGGGVEFSFVYDGKGNSQSQGAYSAVAGLTGKIVMSGAPAPASPFNFKIDGRFDESMKLDFANEALELKSETILSGFSPSAKFEVNGQVVNEAEYKAIREKVKMPGMQDPMNQSEQQPGQGSLACTAEVFQASDFSAVQAEQWILQGGAKPKSMKTTQSCGIGTTQDNWSKNDFSYQTMIDSQTGFTSIRVGVCKSGACDAMERMFFPNEAMSYVDSLLQSNYTILTSCQVVPACAP